jgi:hypothetical protein
MGAAPHDTGHLGSHGKPSETLSMPHKVAVNAGKKPSKISGKHLLPQLDRISSEKEGSSPSEVLRDLKVLQNEVHKIYENHRRLASTLSGPMHVRKDGTLEQQSTIYSAQIEFESNKVSLQGKTIPNIWLRDNCQCSSCMHETTKQRLQDTFAIPKDLSIKSASFTKDVSANKTRISIEWSDGHKSTYTQPLLANAIANFETRASIRQGLVTPELWGSDISRQRATITYNEAVRENMEPVLQNIVSQTSSLFASTRPPRPLKPPAQIRLLLRRQHASRYSQSYRRPPPPHRIHPRNALRRLLRLHRRPGERRYSVHQHRAR